MTKPDRNMLLIVGYRAHPDWSFARLGELFSVSGQRAGQILRAYEKKKGCRLMRKGRHKKKGKGR